MGGVEAGTRIGPYEVLGGLGAGGMGEVYRARDTRIGREVALKVLPREVAADPERLHRFRDEARAVGALNHPGIVTLFEVGEHEGAPFLVTELLEGATLRARIERGPLPRLEALRTAHQVAEALAVAHSKGIVHRDLKPANLFLTGDGRVKLLDFGLARRETKEPAAALDRTDTASGTVLGTVAYMAPEQVRGKRADARADIFALGVILHEMITGRRPFAGAGQLELASAILHDEAPALPDPMLDAIARRCLAKAPKDRFSSALDLAYALEPFLGEQPPGPAPGTRRPHARRALIAGAAVAVVAAAGGAGVLIGRSASELPSPVSWTPLTFRKGMVTTALFTPDGNGVLYTAEWENGPPSVFSTLLGRPEARELLGPGVTLLAASPSGELAVLVSSQPVGRYAREGTLATVPLSGGAPRELTTGVVAAGWFPDGTLVVASRAGIESPPRTVLYPGRGRFISALRVSPRGDAVAFLENTDEWDDAGVVKVIDRGGRERYVGPRWESLQGLAWGPGGDEIWFTAARVSGGAVHAVDLASRRERLVLQLPEALTLHDVARDGRALLAFVPYRTGIRARPTGETVERELAWISYSWQFLLSGNGRRIVFTEFAPDGGGVPAIYSRGTDGSPAARLASGSIVEALSRDGGWIAAISHPDRSELHLVPVGAGSPRTLPRGPIRRFDHVAWFPAGDRVAVSGWVGEGQRKLFIQDVSSGALTELADGLYPQWDAVSPGGDRIVVTQDHTFGGGDGLRLVIDLASGERRALESLGRPPATQVVRWTSDGAGLYVTRNGSTEDRVTIERYDLAAQTFVVLREVTAPESQLRWLQVSEDGQAYAYRYAFRSSRLFLVEGLR